MTPLAVKNIPKNRGTTIERKAPKESASLNVALIKPWLILIRLFPNSKSKIRWRRPKLKERKVLAQKTINVLSINPFPCLWCMWRRRQKKTKPVK
jgi:hypothetical protein